MTAEARNVLIATRLLDRLAEVEAAVPSISPPAQFWLDSDAGPSYCHDCAIIARGREFELGLLINPSPWYSRDDWERAYFEGIDGGFDTTGDNTGACYICNRTLSYILTDEGVQDEIRYYREAPLATVRDEDSYALDRLALNIWAGSPRALILGVSVAVNQAWRIVKAGR